LARIQRCFLCQAAAVMGTASTAHPRGGELRRLGKSMFWRRFDVLDRPRDRMLEHGVGD
jgi:hypothetical protein